jgi:heavy metal translocating P-type ATPase
VTTCWAEQAGLHDALRATRDGSAGGPGGGHGRSGRSFEEMTQRLVLATVVVALTVGGLLALTGHSSTADAVWAAGVVCALLPLTWSVARSLRRGDVGVDTIALVAMVGALAVGEQLAAAVVALMLAGGNELEASAGRRARSELSGLLQRAPRVAHRREGDRLVEVDAAGVAIDDVLVVRAGELVPVDGVVVAGEAVLDTSTLTGESLPAVTGCGGEVRSGTSNVGEVFEMRASRPAADSAYAAIVRLVREAELQRAPFVRLADRYAMLFLPITLAIAAAAWAASGDPVRAVAVLVVATPCPLILAAPVALISGVSRAARAGVIVKGAGVIEQLGNARTVLLDKTGTVTVGRPEILRIVAVEGWSESQTLRIAASLDQLSAHGTAEALVRDAHARGLVLAAPVDVRETPGSGIEGSIDGRRVAVGTADFVHASGHRRNGTPAGDLDGGSVLVGVDGRVVGRLVMGDRLRPESAAMVVAVRRAGVRHVALVSGDRAAVAERIGALIGVDRVYAEQTASDKVDVVRRLRDADGLRPVVMVGDGINDAPALAVADVGIAMAAAGATISSETADAVIVVDRIERVAEAIRIGRRSLHIARQSVIAGMGLSIAAMAAAAAGLLPPLHGALLQEGIDVAVIVNALRARR